MTNSSLAEDIAFVRQMAEEGATAPTLGGRFSVLWGVLVTLALACHWAVLEGLLPLAQDMIGAIWVTMAVVGTIGSSVMGRGLANKPGASAPGNRVGGAVWPVISGGIFLYAIAIAIAVSVRGQPVLLFNSIIPFAFILYAVGASIEGTLFRRKLPWVMVAVSMALAAITMVLIDLPVIYLLAAAGVVLTQIIPGLFDLRAEPKTIV